MRSPNIDVSTPVVIAYRGGNAALAAARTLGRLGVPVYLVSAKDVSVIEHSRYWRDRFWWDFSAPRDETLQFFFDVADRVGGRPILLAVTDWTALFINEYAERLQERYVFPRSPKGALAKLVSKWGAFQAAEACGVPSPMTWLPQSREDVAAFLEEATFPVVVKAADPSADRPPRKGIVRTPRELLEAFEAACAEGPPNVVFQEFVTGGSDRVWMCNAYFDAQARCRAIFTGRKLRQVDETGIASLAVCDANETVADQTRRLMQSVGYRGLLGIGWKYDERDGRYKLLDVNVRLSGVFRLFGATGGMDMVRACYLDLTGQPIRPSTVPAGRKWMLEEDFFCALGEARAGRLTFKQWLQSMRGVKETHWFAADDPVPGIAWFVSNVWPRVVSRVQRVRRRHRKTGKRLVMP